jgi:glycosyltransferase involved in cell wall biosynthesis
LNSGNGAPLGLALLISSVAGGTARHVAALAEGCRDAGMTVTVLGPDAARGLLPAGIAFAPVQIGDRPRPVADAAAILGLRRLLRAARPDVVHAHGVRAGAFAALALWTPARLKPARLKPARLKPARWRRTQYSPAQGPALVVTIHNAPPAGRLNGAVYAALERVCARRADAVLCASADLLARMRDLGVITAELYEVPAPAARAPSAAEVARAAADVGADGRPVVLTVGRLAPQKGLDVLVAAAGRWRDDPCAPRTVIVGGGPLAAKLTAQAGTLRADVLLLGERQDVPALLAVADVFVLPSRWDARALSLQEAMRAARPIVATRTGGTPGLTGEDAAILVPPEDAVALADAVLGVLRDAALAARLGLAARARAATFPAPQDAVSRAAGVYYRLIAARTAPANAS